MKNCGGKFIKIKEPEKTEKKKTKEIKPKDDGPTKRKVPVKSKDQNLKDRKQIDNDIRKYFPDISLNSSSDFSDIDTRPSTSTAINTGETDKIKTVMDSKGTKLGGAGTGRSRLIDMFSPKREPSIDPASKRPKLEVIEIKSEIPAHHARKSIKIEVMHEFDDDDDIILIDDEFDDSIAIDHKPVDIKKEVKVEEQPTTCECPICNEKININEVNQHLDECLTVQMLKESP
jgi:SpoVK/Ycf46/Vps4 family AAA+-type ATPase